MVRIKLWKNMSVRLARPPGHNPDDPDIMVVTRIIRSKSGIGYLDKMNLMEGFTYDLLVEMSHELF